MLALQKKCPVIYSNGRNNFKDKQQHLYNLILNMRKRQIYLPTSPLAADLDHVLTSTKDLWNELRESRLFITGGTGFFGTWLLESFVWANEKLNLNASALVLTRDYNTFSKKLPHLANNPTIKFHVGDIRDFTFPAGKFSHIIHAAATSAVATFNNEDPLVKYDTVVGGTRRTLDFAVHCNARKFLLTSSGAAYGKQPPDLTHIPEDFYGAPDPLDLNSTWGESKRVAELFCTYYAKKYNIETTVARCFSFVGPYLPLDIHYAIGNFIGDALKGGPILVKGDGTPHRSYLYATDLTVWLWTILLKGKPCQIYNVGSEEGITIADLADLVARCCDIPIQVRITKTSALNKPPDRYLPSTKQTRQECGISQTVSLEEAIRKTFAFHRSLGTDPQQERGRN
jgi:nucleoside-diphosphate-sugar epimerase